MQWIKEQEEEKGKENCTFAHAEMTIFELWASCILCEFFSMDVEIDVGCVSHALGC